jgi:hypothetical protein
LKRRARKPLIRWAAPSLAADKKSLRDFFQNEYFAAEIDSVFVTPDGQVHLEGLTSSEVSKVVELAKVLEQLQRRPS